MITKWCILRSKKVYLFVRPRFRQPCLTLWTIENNSWNIWKYVRCRGKLNLMRWFGGKCILCLITAAFRPIGHHFIIYNQDHGKQDTHELPTMTTEHIISIQIPNRIIDIICPFIVHSISYHYSTVYVYHLMKQQCIIPVHNNKKKTWFLKYKVILPDKIKWVITFESHLQQAG